MIEIQHQQFIEKLRAALTEHTALKVIGVALQWLESYLSEQCQCVLIDGVQSPIQN